MTAATAIAFHAAQGRRDRPGLLPNLLAHALAGVERAQRRTLESIPIDALLIPMPFKEARAYGLVGVPVLEAAELDDLLFGREIVDDFQVDAGRWWELWALEDGNFALLPGAPADDLRIVATALVRSGSLVQLRTFDSGLSVGVDGAVVVGAPSIPPELCVRVDEDLEGAPYRGSCANSGCHGGCSADVILAPEIGLYRLLGCSC